MTLYYWRSVHWVAVFTLRMCATVVRPLLTLEVRSRRKVVSYE